MDSFVELLLDQLRAVPGVTWRRMFGGWGFYADGFFFAISFDSRFYLKTAEEDRAAFRARGMGPFTYGENDEADLTSFWEVPADVLEDADELTAWARRAVAAARALRLER